MKFRSILVANRGEISLRVQRSARRMGLRTIAVYSEADRDARHAREADAAVCIGGPAPRDSYLNIDAIIAAARQTGAQAVHPGYGFLAESAGFAQAVIDAGLVWVGPPPAAIRVMGDKGEAKRAMRAAGVPVLAQCPEAGPIDYPVMIKAAAGGGGRGMRLVRSADALDAALAQARSEAEHAFGDTRLILEPALENARHVEVQVFADAHGRCIHLGERDCSVQRRHQKLIEESPSPAVDASLREAMGRAAVAAAKAVGYSGAGTVEFLLDEGRRFWFMEMNTRLQVEHPVTEAITGLDLVEWQLRIAAGEPLPLAQDEVRFEGHAIEARLCAEDAANGFLPQAGRIALWQASNALRVEHALETGAEIPPYYDSMIAKLIAHAPTRDEAREALAAALDATVALGLPTNKTFLAAVLRDAHFARGEATTAFLQRHPIELPEPEDADYAIGAALLAESARYGEWTSWSNVPARAMRIRLNAREVALRFERGVYQAGVRLRVLALESDSARIERDGIEEEIRFVLADGVLHLARGGASHAFRDDSHAPSAKRGAAVGDGRLVSPMNGRVAAVNSRPGDTAIAGYPLIVLEAMKMEHALSLPAAVRIRSVLVSAGAQVSPGQLLLEFEPA